MLNLTSNSRIQRLDKDIAEAEFENNLVLLHIEHGKYYNFNRTGAQLWQYLTQTRTVAELINLLTQKYACTYEECQNDVLAWLNEALSNNLIIQVPAE